MSNPQQPELRRSGQTPSLTPDSIEGELRATDRPSPKGSTGPVPPGNRPGAHGASDQDKPDLAKFAEKLGIDEPDPDGERAHQAAVDSVEHADEGGLLSRGVTMTVGVVGLGVGAVAWVTPKVVRVVRNVIDHRPKTPLERLAARVRG